MSQDIMGFSCEENNALSCHKDGEPKSQSERRYSRIRSVEAEEFWRTGKKTPGSMGRAFNKMYPNRGYSTKTGPQREGDNGSCGFLK